MSEVSRHQLKLLEHTLGLGRGGPSCRNHFVAAPGHTDLADLVALEGLGVFCATNEGRIVAEKGVA